MIRNLKRLGLVLAATGALGVMAAPAQAAPEFTAFNSSTLEHPAEASLHGTLMETSGGSTNHEFTVGEGGVPVRCSTATFTGTRTAPASTTQTVAPTYSSCKGSLGETAHVTMNGCEYRFHVQSEPSESKYTGTMDLLCPGSEGPKLTTTTGGGTNKCIIEIEPGQEGLGTVDFREAEGVVEFEPTVTGIDYFATGGFFNCGITSTTRTDGGYKGNSTVTAKAGETALVFQVAASKLVSAPPEVVIEKAKKNEATITLSTIGKNKMKIVSSPSSPVYNVKKDNCFTKEVECTIEVDCKVVNMFAPLTSTGLDLTTKLYHTAVTKIECKP